MRSVALKLLPLRIHSIYEMKKLTLFLLLLLPAVTLFAQIELPGDSIRRTPTNYKEVGGFLLDMGLMVATPPVLSKPTFGLKDVSRDYNQLFSLNPNVKYTQGYTPFYSVSNGWGGTFSTSSYMQMGSFKLNNGMRINTYGQYNKDGYKVYDPSAMPWERNNFKGAFELKSANGNFGIRIEVQQGRNTAYPY